MAPYPPGNHSHQGHQLLPILPNPVHLCLYSTLPLKNRSWHYSHFLLGHFFLCSFLDLVLFRASSHLPGSYFSLWALVPPSCRLPPILMALLVHLTCSLSSLCHLRWWLQGSSSWALCGCLRGHLNFNMSKSNSQFHLPTLAPTPIKLSLLPLNTWQHKQHSSKHLGVMFDSSDPDLLLPHTESIVLPHQLCPPPEAPKSIHFSDLYLKYLHLSPGRLPWFSLLSSTVRSLAGEGERAEDGSPGNSQKDDAAKPKKQVADLTRCGDGTHREGRREAQKRRLWVKDVI